MAKAPDGRWRRTRPLADSLSRIAGPAFKRRGFTVAEIVSRWPEIVGPMLAEQTLPEKLAFPRGKAGEGVLTLRAEPTVALTVQHVEPELIERVNGYFGYRAVARLKLVQGRVPRRRRRAPPAPPVLDAAGEGRLQNRLAGVSDPEIREVLERLGRWIWGANRGS